MPIFGTINIHVNSILIQIWTPLGTHVGNYITRLVNTLMILCSGVEPQTPMLLALFPAALSWLQDATLVV